VQKHKPKSRANGFLVNQNTMKKTPEIIIRKFTKERKQANGNIFIQTFAFKTYSFIWGLPKDNETLSKLFTYFQQLFIDGIVRDEKDRKSPSSMRQIFQEVSKIDSDLIKFAQDSDFERSEGYQHQIVGNYLLYNDPKTIACEIPVWDDEMSGYIDHIRYYKDLDMLDVIDFKPNAAQNKKAATQLKYYRQLLHERTGIPLDKIMGTYFDDKNAYSLTF